MRNEAGDLAMTNNKTLTAITFGVLIILFNLIVFLVPIPQTTTFWIAYIFITISFLMVVVISYRVISSPVPLKSKFLNLPLIQIVYSYFVVQLIIGAVLFLLAFFRFENQSILVPIVGLVLSAALFGFTISKLSFTKLGINEVERVEGAIKEKTGFMNEIKQRVDQLVSLTLETEPKRALSKLSEAIRFSDPVSNDSTTEIESELSSRIDKLMENFASISNSQIIEECKTIQSLLNQRNIKAKSSK